MNDIDKKVRVVRTVQCIAPDLDPNDERTTMQHDWYPVPAPKFLEQLTSMTPLARGTTSRLMLRTDVT
jgi:hypothetical protein